MRKLIAALAVGVIAAGCGPGVIDQESLIQPVNRYRDIEHVAMVNQTYGAKYYEKGKKEYEANHLEEAKESLKMSIRFTPENKDAADLLADVMQLLGERPSRVRSACPWYIFDPKVKQWGSEMMSMMDQGKLHYAKGEYREATEKFESALQVYSLVPYGLVFPDLKKEAQMCLDDARQKANDGAIKD